MSFRQLLDSSRSLLDILKYSLRRHCQCCDIGPHGSYRALADYPFITDLETTAAGGCRRCSLVLKAVLAFSDQWKDTNPSEIKVNLEPEPLQLWRSGIIVQISILWPNRAKPIGTYLDFDIEVFFEKGTNSLFPAIRPLQSVPVWSSSNASIDKIRDWIKECSRSHSMCNIADENNFLPARLIDTHPDFQTDGVRLVASTDIKDIPVKYAALSHSWGLKRQRVKPIPKTTKQSILDRMNHIPFDELTKTFQDAVIVARKMDIKYLWIDSLCIVQDDDDDFVEQVRNMGKVYGEAYLVISALRAATGDVGLFHERPTTLRISQEDGWGNTVTACVRPGAQHEDFFTALPRSFTVAPLFARAWCFQERLSARRLVHFSESEIVYECNQNLVCECSSAAGPIDLETSGNFRRRQALALQKTTVESRLNTWYDVLRPYTSRSLTVESDRLPALSGFAQRVALPELGRYCAGLWESQLPIALLWRILRPLPENGDLIKRPDDYQAPSWAWPSVQAVVEPYMRFDKRTEIVAEVLEVVCEPATSDPYGSLKRGHIILDAPAVEAVLRPADEDSSLVHGDCRLRTQPCSYRLERDGEHFAFQADLSLQKGSSDYVAFGDIVTCVVIERHPDPLISSRAPSLVLRRQTPDSLGRDQWQRIGTFNLPRHWWPDVKCKNLKIL